MSRLLSFVAYRRALRAAALVAILLLAGCTKTAEISQYKVPREQEQKPAAADVAADAGTPETGATDAGASESPPETAEKPDRMLAALLPVDGNAWTFKLTGPVEAVSKHSGEFAALVKTVTFTKDPGSPPQWKLPEGWTQKAGGGPMRFATITIPGDKPLEVTVATVTWPAGGDTKSLLTNVNRWRGQMQLKEIAADQLADSVRSLKVGDGEAAVVDLLGKFKTGGMTPPFAGKAAGTLPPGHPAIDPSESTPSSSAAKKPSPANPSPKTKQPSDDELAQLPFKFTAPEGWKAIESPQFAVAAFTTGQGGKRVDVSITPMAGAGGDLLMNVNRWRSQLGLPALTADELSTCTDPYKVDGKPAHLVRLMAPEDADPRPAIFVAMIDAGDATWIFKLRGTADAVHSQQENFQKLVDSVKFKP
jgi:hypothetical protein